MSWKEKYWYEEVTRRIEIDWEQCGNENLTADMRSRRLEVVLFHLEQVSGDWRLTNAEIRRRYPALEETVSDVKRRSRELMERVGDIAGLALWIERNKTIRKIIDILNSIEINFEELYDFPEDVCNKIAELNRLRFMNEIEN